MIERAMIAALFALLIGSCAAQTASIESVQQLYDQKQWAEIVQIVPSSAAASPDLDLYLGLALAQLQRWREATVAFEDGSRKAPNEERFPVELAGVAYRTNNLSEATRQLYRALRLNPHDPYALNFLATIYLLRGNVEAALEYWNRIAAPKISQVEVPQPRQSLIDRAITIPPLSVMRLSDFEMTNAQLDSLGIFAARRWELQPDGTSNYKLVLHSIDEHGWGANKWTATLSTLRGLPYETVYPEYRNARNSAINFDSLVRWDSNQRRLFASFSAPLDDDPKWRLNGFADARDENWNLTNTLQTTTQLSALKLRKLEVGIEIHRIESGRWSWQTGASFSRRTFGNLIVNPLEAGSFFSSGNVIEWNAGTGYRVLSLPDKRITIDSTGAGGVGRFFASSGANRFERLQGSIRFHWFPRSEGDDYEMSSQWRAAALFGSVPLDELYTLGVDRDDNDLWLRGISTTRNGQKGNSPMGRRYVLWNWQWDKIIFHGAFFEMKAGPIFDAGDVADPSGYFGSRGWLWDPGAQLTVRVLDTVNVVFSYGHDLRSSQNTLFGAALP
ncbi:MAG TPA: tetratricopeptide repeat protein [Candidatus Acidoferrales bacterium]